MRLLAPPLAMLVASLIACSEMEPAPSTPTSAPPEAPVATGPAELNLATWNLEWLAYPPNKGERPRSDAEIQAMADVVAGMDAHVVAIQEVAGNEAARQLFPEEDWALHLESRQDAQLNGFAVRKGVDVRRHKELKALQIGNPDLRRGVDVELTHNGQAVRLLAVHLRARCQWDPLDQKLGDDCRKLKSQLDVVEGWVDARAAEGVPFVVLGDFNRQLVPDDTFMTELDDQDPSGLRLELALGQAKERCGARRRVPVDHAILGGDAIDWKTDAAQKPLPSALSDHCPVEIGMSVPAPQ